MSLQIILNGGNAGQTNTLVQRMVEQATVLDKDRFFVLVPEQATLKMQKEVVRTHPAHAAMNIDVVSFDRLAHVVFGEMGMDAGNCLDDIGKALILKKVLKDYRNDLVVYKNKTHMAGFVDEMKSIITELKQYSIDDNTLFLMQERARESGNNLLFHKLADIRFVLRKFNEEIKDKYSTSEEILNIFAKVISKSEKLKGAHIYLDGFTGFTPVQYKLLASMLKFVKDITVSITLPEEKITADCKEYDLFYLSNDTYFKLKKLAADMEIELLEDLKGEVPEELQKESYLYSAPTVKDEVTFVAKEILRLVRKENYRFRDIAVVTGDMDSYYTSVRDIFEEAEISSFIDYKSKVTDNQMARFLLAALALGEERLSYDAVFTFLKTGLTGLAKDDISSFENYCLEFGIKGLKAFFHDFTKNKEVHHEEKWNLEEMNRIRKEVESMIKDFYYTIAKKDLTVRDYTQALLKLCERAKVEEAISQLAETMAAEGLLSKAKEYEQIYGLLHELLEKIALLLGNEIIDIKGYREVLESGIKEIKISIIPPSLDACVVGDLTRTRLDKMKALFLVGVNEGKIPLVAAKNGLLTQKERQFLKEDFEIAPTVEEDLYTQRFYLYLALNKPTEKLYLTYANSLPTGESLNPSYLIEDLPELVEKAELQKIEEVPDMTWESESLRGLAKLLRKYAEEDGVGLEETSEEQLLQYYAKKNPEAITQILEATFFSNKQTSLDPQVALDLYGDVLFGSVSRYEKFNECAYKHFLNYGLHMEPRAEYKVEASDLGTLYHDALEKYSITLKERGLSFRDISDEESRKITEESVTAALANLDKDVLESTARMEFLTNRIRQVTLKTTDVLRDHVRAGLFEPSDFEYSFTADLTEKVKFTGKIDRVDIYDGDDVFVKIIDYKSGSKKFSVRDIYSGIQLQLVAYMGEALKKAQADHPQKNVKPGGVYYYRINDKFIHPDENSEDRFKMSGLTSCAEGVISAVDSTIGPEGNKKSNIIEVSYNKSGISPASSIANNEEFLNLLDFVNHKIEDVSEKIKEGCVDIEPYYENDTTNGCNYCDYKDVCKFEAGRFGTDWKPKGLEDKKEIEKALYGRI